MRYFKKIILVVIMSAFICLPIKAEMTLKELFFDESKPFHLKILDVIPEEGIVQIGDENANNASILSGLNFFTAFKSDFLINFIPSIAIPSAIG